MVRRAPTLRPPVLRRLRQQDVCSSHKQRQKDFSVHLRGVLQNSRGPAVQNAAPYQRRRRYEADLRDAPGDRHVFRTGRGGIPKSRAGRAGRAAKHRCRRPEKAP